MAVLLQTLFNTGAALIVARLGGRDGLRTSHFLPIALASVIAAGAIPVGWVWSGSSTAWRHQGAEFSLGMRTTFAENLIPGQKLIDTSPWEAGTPQPAFAQLRPVGC